MADRAGAADPGGTVPEDSGGNQSSSRDAFNGVPSGTVNTSSDADTAESTRMFRYVKVVSPENIPRCFAATFCMSATNPICSLASGRAVSFILSRAHSSSRCISAACSGGGSSDQRCWTISERSRDIQSTRLAEVRDEPEITQQSSPSMLSSPSSTGFTSSTIHRSPVRKNDGNPLVAPPDAPTAPARARKSSRCLAYALPLYW